MIKITDALITQALPEPLAALPEVQAFVLVLRTQIQKLAAEAEKTKIYSSIDTAPETALDILASDMLITTYSQEYSLSVKRDLIKNALSNWMTSGTIGQLQDVVDSIFGSGSKIEEWFSNDEEPGTFKIYTNNPTITDETIDEFKRIVELTKRLSAHLNGVELGLSVDTMNQYYGFFVQEGTEITLIQEV